MDATADWMTHAGNCYFMYVLFFFREKSSLFVIYRFSLPHSMTVLCIHGERICPSARCYYDGLKRAPVSVGSARFDASTSVWCDAFWTNQCNWRSNPPASRRSFRSRVIDSCCARFQHLTRCKLQSSTAARTTKNTRGRAKCVGVHKITINILRGIISILH